MTDIADEDWSNPGKPRVYDEDAPPKPRRRRRRNRAVTADGDPDYSAKLDELTWKALKQWERVLNARVPRSNRGYVRSLTIKERCANNVVRASIALGAQMLRRRQTDKLTELLDLIKREGRNPKLIEQAEETLAEVPAD